MEELFKHPLFSLPLDREGAGGGEENKKNGVASAFIADEQLSSTAPARYPAPLLTTHVLQVDIRRYEAKPVAHSGERSSPLGEELTKHGAMAVLLVIAITSDREIRLVR